MAGHSPDYYRQAAGFRRSEAPLIVTSGRAAGLIPVNAYTAYDLSDPALLELLRDGATSTAGIAVNEHRALRNSTFFRAFSLITGAMGMLPIHLMRRTMGADGAEKIEKARNHPFYPVLHRRPNDFQTAVEFKSYMQGCALLDPIACALVVRSRGAIRQLIPLPRRSVTPKLSDTWDLTFEYRRPSGGTAILQPRDVFHFRSPVSLDGLNGVPLLKVSTDSLGAAIRAQGAAGRLLNKGMMAGGSLETDQDLEDEAIDRLKADMEEQYSGSDNAGKWMILPEGLKAKPFSGSAKDTQLIEMMKFHAEEMSRFSGVPRPLLMFDETSWGSGIEQLGRFFVTYCLMVWFVIWEEAIWRLLEPSEQDTLYAKVNDGALLRGSLKDQADFFAKALGNNGAWMTPNEVRGNFDQNPRDDGNDLPRPGTSAAAVRQDDLEVPDDAANPAPRRDGK